MPPIAGPTQSRWTLTPNRRGRVAVSIQIKDARDAGVSTFERIHGKPMHLVVFPEDLSTVAAHEHPRLKNGTFSARLNLPAGSRYVLFDEYDPAGPIPMTTDRAELNRGAAPGVGAPQWDFDAREKTVGGLTFTLTQDQLMSGMGMPLAVTVVDADGQPAQIKRWPTASGPKGHMFAVQDGLPELYHFHPIESGSGGHGGHAGGTGGMGHMGHAQPAASQSALTFHAEVGQPGAYRVFLQVVKVGARQPLTVYFDVLATAM